MLQLKKKCRNVEHSYKVLSQQELLKSLTTFSVLSNKFLEYYFFRCCITSFNLCHWKNQKLAGKCMHFLKSLQNTYREFTLLKINSIAGIFQGFWLQVTTPILMAYSNKWFDRIGTGKEYCFCVSMKVDILNRFSTYLLLIAKEP